MEGEKSIAGQGYSTQKRPVPSHDWTHTAQISGHQDTFEVLPRPAVPVLAYIKLGGDLITRIQEEGSHPQIVFVDPRCVGPFLPSPQPSQHHNGPLNDHLHR